MKVQNKLPSKVYFIPAKREDGHKAVAKKAEKIFLQAGFLDQIEKNSYVALKIHFGEKGNTGFIKPQWLRDIISHIENKTSHMFLTDTNTLYVSQRSNSVDHLRLAQEHGFTQDAVGIPVVIADGLIGRDGDEIQIDLPRVKAAKIASAILDSDLLLCLSHFTGHMMSGFGAAIKNLGMGCASRAGKLEQHSDVHPWVDAKKCTGCEVCVEYCPEQAITVEDEKAAIEDEKCIGCGECLVVCTVNAVKFSWDSDALRCQEKMSEYAYSVFKHFKGKISFINFLLKITKDCDCIGQDESTIVEDIGILGSSDPIALDKASVDLVNSRSGKDILRVGYDVDWSMQLRHGVKIGLGSMDYELIELD
ncbi:MAG: DUF362 domain-containing protein [Candidatus Aminicenantes bacterium]|nr:MAG: DUF362 domain-containing protein [Candidatus Aminicenantes bacterium]